MIKMFHGNLFYNEEKMEEKTIGALSKFTGVSVHTIKYYEKVGLISSHRDKHSNYRSYDVRVCTDLYECMKYRNMEFSLKETATLLKEADERLVDQMLIQKSREIDQEIERLKRIKKQVDTYRREVDELNLRLGDWFIEEVPHLYVYKQTHNLEYREDAPMEACFFQPKEEAPVYKSIVTFPKGYLNGGKPEFSWGNGFFLEKEQPELEKKGYLHVNKGRAFVFYQRFKGLFSSNGDMAEAIQKTYHRFRMRFQMDAYAIRIKIAHDECGQRYEYFKIIVPLE